jgi:hypothetical protein
MIGAGVNSAQAAPAAPSSAVPTTTTLPLMGAPLVVDVTTGPGGTLATVAVNPADGFTATKVKPNKVVFTNADGSAKVVVGEHHGGQQVAVKAGSLANVSGNGGWSGDVFNTGTATTVAFTIGATATGGPDITGVTTSDPSAVIGATEYDSGEGHDGQGGQGQEATVKITFTSGGQSRSLRIRVSVETDENGDTHAKASVSLGRLRGVVQAVADAIGDKSWTGMLCDGSTATIKYTINADGSITNVTADPTTATIQNDGSSVIVRFSPDEKVRIRTHTSADGIKVDVNERIRCQNAPTPSVNTPVSTDVPSTDHTGDHQGGDGGGDHHGGHDGQQHG